MQARLLRPATLHAPMAGGAVEDRRHLTFQEKPDQDLDSMVPIDIRVEIGEKILPCRSTLLALSSEVLRGMFASTKKETWSKGVTAAFQGLPTTEAQAFLAIVHGATVEEARALVGVDEANYDKRVMDGIVALATKLNAPRIVKVRVSGMFLVLSFLLWVASLNERNAACRNVMNTCIGGSKLQSPPLTQLNCFIGTSALPRLRKKNPWIDQH
jgi:hypothetical protein